MANTQTAPPEWIDAKEAQRIFCLGKTTLYRLMADGKIRTSLLRKRGSTKGRRLFSYDSVKAFIEANVTEAAADTRGED